MSKKLVIAVDGPGAAGKGTLCTLLSKHFNIPHLNTGGLYRGTTYKALQNNVSLDDVDSLVSIAKNLTMHDINNPEIFNEEIGIKTSSVAKIQEVRDALLQYQRDFADQPDGAILDGRDIGTTICPDANYKFFIVASAEERAKRRYKETIEKGLSADYEDIFQKILERDKKDAEREASPFRKASDAIEIDTTTRTINEVFEYVLSCIK
ncbi:MAG: (d)CMP kinase [Rickettsiales bacterium]|jgi:cytidylate kinase|nr:(d)CMP kinase [Rickettsiales bacterium]